MFTKARWSLGKLASSVFTRGLLIFAAGLAAGMAWQTYGGDVRTAVAGWSPHLAFVAPASSAAGSPRERLKATTVALNAVRQSVDKLATEVDKLQDQAADQRSGSGSRRGNSRR